MTSAPTQRALGWRAPETLGRAPHVGARTGMVSGWDALRPAVELGDLPEVWDQHAVGSCTAQAVAAAIWILLVRAGYAPELIDRAGIYRRAREAIGTAREDSGAILADVIAAAAEGWTAERAEPPPTWGPAWEAPAPVPPPSAPRVVSWEALDYDDLSICTEIDAGHVVVVGLQITAPWEDFDGDTLPPPAGDVVGGHALAIVGYDSTRRMYLIRNSWSRRWRRGGYAWIPWDWIRAPWCGEAHVLRAVRRAEGPLPERDLDDADEEPPATPLDAMEAGILAAMPPRAAVPAPAPSTRHALDVVGRIYAWHYPLPRDPLRLVEEWRAHGIDAVIPQQSAQAIAWSRTWGPRLRAAGVETLIGLGKIDAGKIVDALDVPAALGCMVNQEDWKSVADSLAVCDEVLRRRPNAAARTMDCHYPALTTNPETGRPTGWGKIARAWSRLCTLRAPQCYWARGAGGTSDGPYDGWVSARLQWARRDYPLAGGSPASHTRLSRQLYRASVQDHVVVALRELSTGALFLWNWPEADASAKCALRIVVALRRRGFTGVTAVRDFQLAAGGLAVDGVVGPATCAALGIPVPQGVTWTRRRRITPRELAFVTGREPRRGEVTVERVTDAWILRGPDVRDGIEVDELLVSAAPGTWRVEGTGIVLRDVPAQAPWEIPGGDR